MTDKPATSPLTLLIAALGGEGGGVLTGWIVEAAEKAGYPVQATSIPGVAQRTGATTYYIELWPEKRAALGGRRPVLSLAPAAGEVDVFASSELLEAGRAIRGGYVTPERTLLIASTHRSYTVAEKSAMADGRFDSESLRKTAIVRSRRHILFDMERVAEAAAAPLSAVLLGAIAGAGILPIACGDFEAAIRADGRAVEANLRGFAAGLAAVEGPPPERQHGGPATAGIDAGAPQARLEHGFPEAVHGILGEAVRRLADYQDADHAALYIDRLEPFRAGDDDLLAAVARQLALRMSYEDIVRVAQAKTRPGRIARIRDEAGAEPRDTVVITEFFKPGLAEICDILPVRLASWILAQAERRPRLARLQIGMELRSTTLWGYGRLRLLARLRRFRRASWRYAQEQRAIGDWLDLVARAAQLDTGLAREIAECARLIKGYGRTHRRGIANFTRIVESLVRPALAGRSGYGEAAAAVAAAREASLADPEGTALDAALQRAAIQEPEAPCVLERAG